MRETPTRFNAARVADGGDYPADRLARFSYHTGGDLRPLDPDEPCPVLFRDIGPVAMARFLRGQLRRLAGPFSPIIYLRTEEYREPYTDFGRIGRLAFLRPLALHPWHSGIASIYVAHADRMAEASLIGFVHGDVPLARAAEQLAEARHTGELREAFGRHEYDDARADTLTRLDRLNAEHEAAERLAEPLRRRLQSCDSREREHARESMQRIGLDESDLCTAWHHLPGDRREIVVELLRQGQKGNA
jgi:hypothetical protein